MSKVVYVHKTKDGNIFYVGKGSIDRAFTKELSESIGVGTGRGFAYSSFVKSINFDYDVEILYKHLTPEESTVLEKITYSSLIRKFKLTNIHPPSTRNSLDFEELSNRYYYDETSPSCLRWKVDCINPRNGVKLSEKDSPVGYVNSRGYYVTKINQKACLVHRIILILAGFDLDDEDTVVDHINGNRTDNRLTNLRQVSYYQNNQNKVLSKNSSSGIPGVSYAEYGNRWRASCIINNKEKCKYFSCLKYGYEKAKQLAIKAREEMLNSKRFE